MIWFQNLIITYFMCRIKTVHVGDCVPGYCQDKHCLKNPKQEDLDFINNSIRSLILSMKFFKETSINSTWEIVWIEYIRQNLKAYSESKKILNDLLILRRKILKALKK